MEMDSWCISGCGKLVMDNNTLYCSIECKNNDSNNKSIKYQQQTPSTVVLPPLNLHFSITITPNIFKASDSNAKASSPSSMSSSYTDSNVSSSFTSIYTLDQDFNENYNYVYTTRCCNKYECDEDNDNDYYTSYYSTSNPIDIPSPRTQAASDPALEPNKGTFGKEKSILENSIF